MTRHGELDNGVEETYAYGGRPRDDYGHDPERSDYYYDHDGYHDELAGYPPGYGQTDYTQLPGYETGPVDADYPYPQTGGYPLPPVARAEDPRAAVHPPPPPMPPPPAAPAPPPV
ncbi:MAG: hypothetical protein IRZ08_17440, partial [Frankia sp.]|nr:hypothetical protein [Frankia sp.]